MTLPTNGEFSNRELSIEELDTIAAGSWLGDAWNAISHGASTILHDVGVVIKWVEDHWPKTPHGPYGSGAGLKSK